MHVTSFVIQLQNNQLTIWPPGFVQNTFRVSRLTSTCFSIGGVLHASLEMSFVGLRIWAVRCVGKHESVVRCRPGAKSRGNAEDLGMSCTFLRHMRDQFKMNILAVEYPGYGLLGSVNASEALIKEVVLTAFRFILDELKVAYEQIILFGRSIGSGPAIYIASRFPVGGLILVAAFASIREVIKSLGAGHILN